METDADVDAYAFDAGNGRRFAIVAQPVMASGVTLHEVRIPLADWTSATVEVEHRLRGGMVSNEIASITTEAGYLVITTDVLVGAGDALLFQLTATE